MKLTGLFVTLGLAAGCAPQASTSEPGPADPAQTPVLTDDIDAPGENDADGSPRPLWSVEECEQNQGTLVGDIGDGATRRPDYRCENGKPPAANVDLGIEGSVCCIG